MARSKQKAIDPMGKMPDLGLRGYAMVDFIGDVPYLCDPSASIGYWEGDRPNPNEHPRKRNNTGGPMRYFGDQ